MKCLNYLLLLLPSALFAQKKEAIFDFRFQPTDKGGRYYVITEPDGNFWKRTAYYAPEGTQAMEGTYLDSACTRPHGYVNRFHLNRNLRSRVHYQNGVQQGVALRFNADGLMTDSSNYVEGRRRGLQLGWTTNGIASDSLWFDEAGNGTLTRRYASGALRERGRFERDTVHAGRWEYFYEDGKPLAIEEYSNGKRILLTCFDPNGAERSASDCEEREADFPGGTKGWIQFLEENLRVPKKAKAGYYTVVLRFVVQADGSLTDLAPQTSWGMGLELEVMRLLKASPRWVPAMQFGRPVKAYRTQPVTFVSE